jgi:hypothetical protein
MPGAQPEQPEQPESEVVRLRRELKEAKAECAHWKANHDHMAEVKRAVLDRPDLAERAQLVQKLITERDAGCGVDHLLVANFLHEALGSLKGKNPSLELVREGIHRALAELRQK